MKQDWQELMQLVQDKKMHITKVELENPCVSIEGKFELPPLAKLSIQDQVFISIFVVVHGSIKEMEAFFGISYPTVKARLKKISSQLKDLGLVVDGDLGEKRSVLDRLANNEISVDAAIIELEEV